MAFDGGQYLWAALAWTIISNDTGLRITVVDTAGTEESMSQLQNKRVDITTVRLSIEQ